MATIRERPVEDEVVIQERPVESTSSDNIIRERPVDDVNEESTNLLAEIPKQFAIGVINEALLGFPLFALEKVEGKQAREELTSDTTAGRISRGVGTTAGFLVGLPAKVFTKGGSMAGRIAIKYAPKLVGAGKSIKELSNAERVARGAIEGAGGMAGIGVLSAPEEELAEKKVTVPLSIGLGAAFGVASESLKPVISNFISNVTKGNKSAFVDELADNLLTEIDRLKLKKDELITSGKLTEAQDLVNTHFTGALRQKANSQIEVVSKLAKQDIIPVQDMSPESLLTANEVKASGLKNNNLFTSTRAYLNNQGVYGKELTARLDAVRNNSESKNGEIFLEYQRARHGLSKDEMDNFVDVMEGRAASMNNKVQTLVDTEKAHFAEVAQIDSSLGGTLTRKTGVDKEGNPIFENIPFIPRKDYFPHLVIDTDAPNKVINETLNAAVKRGDFKNIDEAKASWESYRTFASGKKTEKILDYLVSSGQAKDKVEAEKFLNEYIMEGRQIKFGNLERSRQINLPFYDVNPDRVIPKYFEGAHYRLEGMKQFGVKDEMKDKLVNLIREDGGDYRSAELAYGRFFGTEPKRNAFEVLTPGMSSKIRNFETVTKLGLAQIPNASQSVNTAISTGILNTFKGIKDAFTKEGKDFALRTGETLQYTITDVIRHTTGVHSSIASHFLTATGFTAIERMNRVIAANAGRSYAENLAKELIYKPFDKGIQRRFTELGVNPKKIIANNGLTTEDIIKVSQSVVNKTQFRSGVLDLPLFFTSPEGKLITQFKTFAFNQTKFVKDEILKEAARGNMVPIITALVSMPIVGEGVRDIKSIITGKSRDAKGLARIAENIGAVGSLGVFSDLIQSAQYGKTADFLGGPAVSDISKIVQGIVSASRGKPKQLKKTVVGMVPIAGPILKNRISNF